MEGWTVKRRFLVKKAGTIEGERARHRDDNHASGRAACNLVTTSSEAPHTTRQDGQVSHASAYGGLCRLDRSIIDLAHWTTQPITPDDIVECRLIWAGILTILSLLVQANACHSETEIMDMPQVYLLFATAHRGHSPRSVQVLRVTLIRPTTPWHP
jgi:hypothetical protein